VKPYRSLIVGLTSGVNVVPLSEVCEMNPPWPATQTVLPPLT